MKPSDGREVFEELIKTSRELILVSKKLLASGRKLTRKVQETVDEARKSKAK